MTKTIRLTNTGRRTITYGQNAHFRPGTSIDFPAEMGERLRKIYPDELKLPGDNLAQYVGSDAPILKKSAEEVHAKNEAESLLIKAKKEQEALAAEREAIDSERAALAAEREAFEAEKNSIKKAPSRSKAKQEEKPLNIGIPDQEESEII